MRTDHFLTILRNSKIIQQTCNEQITLGKILEDTSFLNPIFITVTHVSNPLTLIFFFLSRAKGGFKVRGDHQPPRKKMLIL